LQSVLLHSEVKTQALANQLAAIPIEVVWLTGIWAQVKPDSLLVYKRSVIKVP
jgi:hypothetical protein